MSCHPGSRLHSGATTLGNQERLLDPFAGLCYGVGPVSQPAARAVRLGLGGCQLEVAASDDSGRVGADSRWGHSGFVYPGRVDLRALVSCASFFSVGRYVCFHMLAGGILLRFRLPHAPGQTRGHWFLLAAEQPLKESHLDTPNPTSYLAVGVAVGLLLVKALDFKQSHPLGLRRLQSFPFLTGKGCVACLADI